MAGIGLKEECKIKFLLVDDNDISLEIQKLMLESCGLTVVTAESGRQAVELAEKEDFFMIFMDIHMPELNGYETAALIRRKSPDVPIIALSADEISDDDEDFKSCGMNGSLLKPLLMDDLRETLNKYLVLDIAADDSRNSSDIVFSYDELAEVMKDEDAILRLITRFLSIHGNDCADIRRYAEKGEFLPAREIMHNITGISGNMFCKRLYKACCVLGDELRNESFGSIDEFTEIWNETIDALEERQKILSENAAAKTSDADWNILLKNFISLCGDFDVAAADLFSENINIFMANMDADSFKKLENAVFSYDFLWITDNLLGNME